MDAHSGTNTRPMSELRTTVPFESAWGSGARAATQVSSPVSASRARSATRRSTTPSRQAQVVLDAWREDDNAVRPHSALQDQTPDLPRKTATFETRLKADCEGPPFF